MPVTFPVSNTNGNARSDAALGILVCEREGNPPFAESSFIKRLHAIGTNSGLRLFAFAPWTWNAVDDTVKGWNWSPKKRQWESSRRPLPALLYDRAWPDTEEEKLRFRLAMRRLRSSNKLVFLNGRLPHKGKVYEILSKDRAFEHLIPPTAFYKGPASLATWLRKNRGSAFLKPIAGSQGKRVVSIVRSRNGEVRLTGRQGDNRPISTQCETEADALQRVERWIGDRAYLMQPMLQLHGPTGEPFDLRVLMQKDNSSRWTCTGIAARLGAPGSVTANLHGGGTSASAKEVLAEYFGERRCEVLLEDIGKSSYSIVARLEQTFGRFAEIGLDFGVDRNGKLWFLEANSKPGRNAMRSAGQEAARVAAERPLSYARSILLRLATIDTRRSPLGNGCSIATTDAQRSPTGNDCATPGRVIHEFDHL